MAVYRACIISTLLYGSESWATYTTQERKLNTFHMRCLKRILGIKWDQFVTNTTVLEKCGMQTIFYMISERRLRWLGHVSRMSDGRIPKDILYGELAEGTRARGRPNLRFKDVCKRDMKAGNMDPDNLGEHTKDRNVWRQSVKTCVANAEKKRLCEAEEKRAKRKESKIAASSTEEAPLSSFFCPHCRQRFEKQNALYSHLRTHHRFCVD